MKVINNIPTKNHQSKRAKRKDAEFNHARVRDAYLRLLQQNKGRKPTTRELALECGLNPSTIKDHVKDLDLANTVDKTFRILTDDVVLSIYRSAMRGSAASQRLWMQVIENWSERTETRHSGEIQVSNEPPVILQIMRKD